MVVSNSVDIHGYADDHVVKRNLITDTREEAKAGGNNIIINWPLYSAFFKIVQMCSDLQNCLTDIMVGMVNKRLKMSDSEREFIYYGSRQQINKCKTQSTDVNSVTVHTKNIY